MAGWDAADEGAASTTASDEHVTPPVSARTRARLISGVTVQKAHLAIDRAIDGMREVADRAALDREAIRALMEEPPVRQPKLRRIGRRWRQVATL